MADEDDTKEYRWETGYEKTWESIKEDDEGFLQASVADIVQRAKRKRQSLKHGSQKLGMMRHLFILLDCSESMSSQDLKPTRLICTLKLVEMFLEEFFDQNPISQVGIILMQNKRAEKISELAGNCRKHIKVINSLNRTSLQGEPSLQNGLDMAMSSLKLLPAHASREILVIMGSLTTCDPGDITKTIDVLKQEGVRCSVIGLAAEVHVCRLLADQTNGTYNVILDDIHFKDLLMQQVDPPPAAMCLESNLIKMGFPHQLNVEGSEEPLTMCMCHVDSSDDGSKLTTGGYYCPQCYSKYCELPVECRACGLTLVSAPHLARSYHHLFPAANYIEINFDNQVNGCFACQRILGEADKQVYNCPNCKKIFCIDCDIFIHETLHTCPGCATNPSTFQIALTT
ncbi:general transcription factor IIH subunit 2 [Diorhabda sublineata]|uniref:general transcription factor IIH subunit 2 n=1 Tax=Diorhabda sublineata TaxID=1163346 RepID=UPI0024E13A0A|nr:general transcription factor IIH subunit 2 [Diorhabda sublineata]XP_056647581.1 general transcription factor IIH subunit 2 [Diorhabda sublineata]